jgi:hypothetical protein
VARGCTCGEVWGAVAAVLRSTLRGTPPALQPQEDEDERLDYYCHRFSLILKWTLKGWSHLINRFNFFTGKCLDRLCFIAVTNITPRHQASTQ